MHHTVTPSPGTVGGNPSVAHCIDAPRGLDQRSTCVLFLSGPGTTARCLQGTGPSERALYSTGAARPCTLRLRLLGMAALAAPSMPGPGRVIPLFEDRHCSQSADAATRTWFLPLPARQVPLSCVSAISGVTKPRVNSSEGIAHVLGVLPTSGEHARGGAAELSLAASDPRYGGTFTPATRGQGPERAQVEKKSAPKFQPSGAPDSEQAKTRQMRLVGSTCPLQSPPWRTTKLIRTGKLHIIVTSRAVAPAGRQQ